MKSRVQNQNTKYLTYGFVAVILFFYLYNLLINGLDAITGATPHQMLEVGALTESSNKWKLLSSLFVHGSIGHLLMNIVLLIILGNIVSNEYGKILFVIIFIFSGLLGNVFTILINHSVVVFGASGSIYGFLGAFSALLITNRNITIEKDIKLVFGVLMTVCISVIYTLIADNVNVISHIAGLFAGFVIPLISTSVIYVYRLTASTNNYKRG